MVKDSQNAEFFNTNQNYIASCYTLTLKIKVWLPNYINLLNI